ncbi:hypothetical protein QE418_000643 [Microbacterium testaceum]|uniref:hypothetical protein n=1 Tax=Microbacterium TaxID=33882 RepID=UPI0027846E0B|nr:MULTISPECIES: hypothetical protein [Microbacterium]MDQ1111195.1 hypothetical protein [Microbacterium testaceum]MDR6098265.1 hypothetical protein [Microbacterium sp. SORGH_AS_0454]
MSALYVIGMAIAIGSGCAFGRAVALGEKTVAAIALGGMLVGIAMAALSSLVGGS